MAGIYGVLSLNEIEVSNIFNYFHSSKIENILNQEKSYKNFLYGRSVIRKFLDDRAFYEDENIIIVFEGIFFNKMEEKSFETLKEWYKKDKIGCIKNIKGQFSGFIYDKKIDKLYIFNDHLSSKPLYFFKNSDFFIFASELKVITKLLSKLKIKKELDYNAIYSMLAFGHMLENITYEKNIKKLNYSSILEVDNLLTIDEQKYFTFIKNENIVMSKETIIEKIDVLLRDAVKSSWNKNKEYHYPHYIFLSGGLDSRTNLLLAKKFGFEDILTVTFGESNSADRMIAQEIARKEHFNHLFYALDNGVIFEKALEEYVLANDGLNSLIGSAAGYSFSSMFKHEKFGGLHTGQIGDVIFGSYVKSNFKIEQGAINPDMIKSISFIENIREKYNENPEIFAYEQRVNNGTLNGDRTIAHFTDMISPFYDRDLIAFSLQIPDRYKKNEELYIEWFKLKHAYIAEYKWEQLNIKPKSIYHIRFAKEVKRYKNAIKKKLHFRINSMNPFEIWLEQNRNIIKNLDDYFNKSIDKIEDIRLKEEFSQLYYKDKKEKGYSYNNKFLVITILLALKIHFWEN